MRNGSRVIEKATGREYLVTDIKVFSDGEVFLTLIERTLEGAIKVVSGEDVMLLSF